MPGIPNHRGSKITIGIKNTISLSTVIIPDILAFPIDWYSTMDITKKAEIDTGSIMILKLNISPDSKVLLGKSRLNIITGKHSKMIKRMRVIPIHPAPKT